MDFVREFLSRRFTVRGGIVEDEGGVLHALLPPAEAEAVGLAEEARILIAGEIAGAGDLLDARLGSPLLERLVADTLARVPVTAAALPAELPRALPDDLPVLLNAVRAGAAERSREPARYLVAVVRAVLRGEDVRSARAVVAIRLFDGARVTPFALGGAYDVTTRPIAETERRLAAAALRAWSRRETPRLLEGALETLRRRAARDLDRMAEYYESLEREMTAAVERARSEEERERRRQKRALVPQELEARRDQLRDRMRARLSAELVTATLVETEVDRFEIPLKRRSRECRLSVWCRAADRRFEGPACGACGRETLRLYLCDERLHPLCEECGHAGRLDRERCPACTPTPVPEPPLSVDDPTRLLRFATDAPPS